MSSTSLSLGTWRRLSALFVMAVLAGAMVPVAAVAQNTGPVPSNAVKFEVGVDGAGTAKQPVDFPAVTITLVSWDELDGANEPHGITFTVAGLTAEQYVTVSFKSGEDIEQPTRQFGNGTYTIYTESGHAISNVVMSVHTEDEPPTTEPPTTEPPTTEPPTTEPPTTEPPTTEPPTTEPPTTEPPTTEPPLATTTTEPEVMAETTTTVTATTSGTLPFTGSESTGLAIVGLAALAVGGGLLLTTRENAENKQS